MDLVKSVIIEVRPRLRSCSFFLTTIKLMCHNSLKITVRPDCIVLSYFRLNKSVTRQRNSSSSSFDGSSSEYEDETPDVSQVLNVKSHFKLMPGSLTSLKIENNIVSFRVLTDVPGDGKMTSNFFHEYLNADSKFLNQEVNHATTEKQTVKIEVGKSVFAQCCNCLNKLTGAILYDRILELPSENYDISDFFCHGPDGHCHSSSSKNKEKFKADLKKTDLFYGLCYFLIDISNFNESFVGFNKKRNELHCNRCLHWLGLKINANFKFWNSCVKFKYTSTSDEIDFHLLSYSITDSYILSKEDGDLKDFLFVIKRLIRDCLASLQNTTSCRFILECPIVNKTEEILLIWVMDRDLEILTIDKNIIHDKPKEAIEVTLNDTMDKKNPSNSKLAFQLSEKKELVKSECSSNELNKESFSAIINLEKKTTTKFLYKLTQRECNLGLEWESVTRFEITPAMLKIGITHLKLASEGLPPSCSNTNGYQLTYLHV